MVCQKVDLRDGQWAGSMGDQTADLTEHQSVALMVYWTVDLWEARLLTMTEQPIGGRQLKTAKAAAFLFPCNQIATKFMSKKGQAMKETSTEISMQVLGFEPIFQIARANSRAR